MSMVWKATGRSAGQKPPDTGAAGHNTPWGRRRTHRPPNRTPGTV